MILLIDNYDSFVHNLGRYFQRLGQAIHVTRNDQVTVDEIRGMAPSAIVISPGPCTPDSAGISLDVVKELSHEIPILGVCLGHQAIGQAFGAKVVLANEPVHGRISKVHHDGSGLFEGVPQLINACRYHSLIIEDASLPECLKKTAWLEDGTVMGIEHQSLPVFGIQFHPESVLTSHGFDLLARFLSLAGLEVTANVPTVKDECYVEDDPAYESPDQPVTF